VTEAKNTTTKAGVKTIPLRIRKTQNRIDLPEKKARKASTAFNEKAKGKDEANSMQIQRGTNQGSLRRKSQKKGEDKNSPANAREGP